MRISQKLDYAHRALIQLTKRYDGKHVSKLDEISECEEIPASFLVQIMTELKKSGLVLSKRGKAGGYQLARSPSEITLADVIASVEPHLLESVSGQEGDSGRLVKAAWDDLSEAFVTKARGITLEAVNDAQREPMWFI